MGSSSSLRRATSVSYTHLDVYKRQVLARKNTNGTKPSGDELLPGDINGDADIDIEDIMGICRILARQAAAK